jgi:hypothetical protein
MLLPIVFGAGMVHATSGSGSTGCQHAARSCSRALQNRAVDPLFLTTHPLFAANNSNFAWHANCQF